MVAQFLGRRRSGLHRDTMVEHGGFVATVQERKSTGFLGRRRSEFHRTGWWSTVASWQLFRVVGLLSIAPRRRLKPCRTGGWGWWLGGSCSGAEEHGVLGAAEIRIWLDTQGGASWLRTGSSGSKEHGVFGRRRLELCGDTGVGALSLRANCSDCEATHCFEEQHCGLYLLWRGSLARRLQLPGIVSLKRRDSDMLLGCDVCLGRIR